MPKETVRTSFAMSKELTTSELQLTAARALCALIHQNGVDSVKVLVLQMFAAGGNNRLALEALSYQFTRFHAMESK